MNTEGDSDPESFFIFHSVICKSGTMGNFRTFKAPHITKMDVTFGKHNGIVKR